MTARAPMKETQQGEGMKSITIYEDGRLDESDEALTLPFLQKQVGGYIEPIRLEGCTAYVNEEGKFNGASFNPSANVIVRKFGARLDDRDNIMGPVVFVGPADRDGNETALPEYVAVALREMAGMNGK